MANESPLAPEQTEFLTQEIIREAKRTLVGRRLLGVHGPLGAGLDTVTVEQYGPDEDAEIELLGRTDPRPVGAPLDASRAIRAAHAVADREDMLIFNGEPKLGLEGLLNAADRHTVPKSDWSKYGNFYRDVVRATEKLLSDNHHRPFALAVSANDYARLVQQLEGQFAPEVDSILRLCDDGVYNSPTIPAGKAVLLSTGDQNFDVAVTEDLSMTFLGERDQDYPFRVYECLVLRIKRPKAICTIE
jgi:uncharacterized linocin/CFP29 family protein